MNDKLDAIDFIRKFQDEDVALQTGFVPSYETYLVKLDYNYEGFLYMLISNKPDKIESLNKTIRESFSKFEKESIQIFDGNYQVEKATDSLIVDMSMSAQNPIKSCTYEMGGENPYVITIYNSLEKNIQQEARTIGYLSGLAGFSLYNYGLDQHNFPVFIHDIKDKYLKSMAEFQNLVNNELNEIDESNEK